MIGAKFNITTHNAVASAEFVYIYYINVINVIFPILNVI